jgi:uncharacterized protein (TIGR03437 family)
VKRFARADSREGSYPLRLAVLWLCLGIVLEAADGPELSPLRVVNAAGRFGGQVAPGEIVVLFPANVGPEILAGAHLDHDGRVTTLLGETRVWFDGIAAPVSYTVKGDVETVVPYEVANCKTTEVVVEYQGLRSPPVTLAVVESAPALFTLDSSGEGQAAMLNETGCCNSRRNPAIRGGIAVLYATGEGQTKPPGVTGSVSFHDRVSDYPVPQLPVKVTVGGQPAEIVYAGEAPHAIAGLLQVNFRVPANAPVGHAIPIALTLGDRSSPDGVTMAIRSSVQRILVVAPGLETRNWFHRVLARARYEVCTARNGREALAQAKQGPIDLVIASLSLPEADRMEAIRAMRAEYPQLKIIGTAPAVNPASLKAADLLGAQAMFATPFVSQAVLHRVRELLRPHPVPYVADAPE